MGKLRYTKAELESLVFQQLENLNAMHDLLIIMKVQNELLHKTNKKLEEEISGVKVKSELYPKGKRKRRDVGE